MTGALTAATATQSNGPAFHSDCTHEILPVKEGVRVTVTYNLYVDSLTLQDHLTSTTTKFMEDL